MNLMSWWKKKNDDRKVAKADPSPRGMERFRFDMDRLFDRFWNDPWDMLEGLPRGWNGWSPVVDVVDGDREIVVRAEIPGVDPERIDVSVSGNRLILSGVKEAGGERTSGGVTRSEIVYGEFRRAIPIPGTADPEKVSAEIKAGVLTVRIGKSETSVPKRVPVSVK